MIKDAVLILDDDEKVREGFRYKFEDDIDLGLDLIECSSYKEYEDIISQPETKNRIKAFILDLANSPHETDTRSFKAAEYILYQYENNRVPIFVHSANIEHYDELEDKGTVFKVTKDPDSTTNILDSIKLMKEAGFLDIFCVEGSLQRKIMSEIHSAFIEQFKGKDIEEIIKSIKSVHPDDIKHRTIEVFERIAVRAVYQNFIVSKDEDAGSVKLNAIEHYYRRKRITDYNTGDLFEHIENKQIVFIATPRCNLSHKNYFEILLCQVNSISNEELSAFKKTENVQKSITDDVTSKLIGEKRRFLPKTPQFEGGFVEFNKTFSIKAEEMQSLYKYKISLVDDLTNDVIRKLASYLMRGGISDTHYAEAQHYLREVVAEIKSKS